jgi:hypothetical protein
MLGRIELHLNERSNYQADEPRKAWGDFHGGFGDIAKASGDDGEVAVKKPVADRRKSLAAKDLNE